jgi:hypothetical protein
MAHGPLPPVPIFMAPVEVVTELIDAGEAAGSRNPATEFSAGPWMMGLLMYSGGVSSAITIKGGIDGLRAYARRLHRWNTEEPANSDGAGKTERRSLRYQSEAGTATLDLNSQPSLEAVRQFVEAAYKALELDVPKRSD